MEFETVQIGNVHYVTKNGVMGTPFTMKTPAGWCIFVPVASHTVATKEEALVFISNQMDTWYTTTEAVARLMEMGIKASTHDVCMWARNGLLPDAVKITGKGGWGRGGSWRIPQKALGALAERRGQ